MEIIAVSDLSAGGSGITRVTVEICERLRKRHQVLLVATKRIGVEAPRPKNCRIRILPSINVPLTNLSYIINPSIKREALRLIAEDHDVLYAHNADSAFAARDLGIPLVTHVHSVWTPFFFQQQRERYKLPEFWWRFFERQVLRTQRVGLSSSDAIIYVSHYLKRLVGEEGVVIPNGVDTSCFSLEGSAYEFPHRPAALFVGRVEAVKGIHVLISALRNTRYHVYLVGRIVDDFDFPSNFHVLGEMPHEEIPKFMRGADMLVNPVLRDGFEIVNMEALACGCPVVTTEGFERTSIYSGHALLVRTNSPEALKRAVDEVSESPPNKAELVEFAKSYDWDQIALGVEDILREVTQATRV